MDWSGSNEAAYVTSPFVTINQANLTAQQTAGFAASGYTAPTTFFITNPTTGPHWQIWEGDDDDLVYDQRFTDGAAHVYGLARNAVLVDSATAYNTTEIFGFICVVVSGAGDATITMAGDSTSTAITMADAAFTVGQVYPLHLTELIRVPPACFWHLYRTHSHVTHHSSI